MCQEKRERRFEKLAQGTTEKCRRLPTGHKKGLYEENQKIEGIGGEEAWKAGWRRKNAGRTRRIVEKGIREDDAIAKLLLMEKPHPEAKGEKARLGEGQKGGKKPHATALSLIPVAEWPPKRQNWRPRNKGLVRGKRGQ